VHFYPGAWLPAAVSRLGLGATPALMDAYARRCWACWCWSSGRAASVASVLCGFVLPYAIWFTVFSMTAFLQHTNPQLRWYRDVGSIASPPEALSVHVGFRTG
jgi:sugar (pentulose or hexulose) kinase